MFLYILECISTQASCVPDSRMCMCSPVLYKIEKEVIFIYSKNLNNMTNNNDNFTRRGSVQLCMMVVNRLWGHTAVEVDQPVLSVV